ncbi:MAG: pyruvate kinase [Rikenellaceae bacterium]|nr:pyruvate kinase [Rikenellaceae bacterium]MCL2692501.1 pyruvate kinase [Rikenellaceae bacterium]
MTKKTKIIATISDARCDVDFIQSLFDAGMNTARINTAHASLRGAAKVVENVRKVSDSIAVMIDTKGPEVRVTGMADAFKAGISVAQGDIISIRGTAEDLPSSREMVYMNHATICDDVPVGAKILIDDGELEIEVVEKADCTLVGRVNNAGVIKSNKSVNIPDVEIDLPTLTDRDREYIQWAIENDIDFIAHSFVRSAADVLAVQQLLDAAGSPIKIISKIENREGVNNIDEIIRATYGIMVARGDLGVEIPAEQIPQTQRYIVRKCIESKTPVIIATQMLHSMIHSPRPTRAEVSDIANAIYQRVDAIMLSGETASGDYPVESVRIMTKIAHEVENDTLNEDTDINTVLISNEVMSLIAHSAVQAAQSLPVRAIVIDTKSGRTALHMAAFRSSKPVYAVCYSRSVMRQLALSFGIQAVWVEPQPGKTNYLLRMLYSFERHKWLDKSDLVVMVAGSFGDQLGASFMEISTVENLQNKPRQGA